MGVGMGMVVRVSCHTSNGTHAEPNPPIEIRLAAVTGNERVAADARGAWSAAAGRLVGVTWRWSVGPEVLPPGGGHGEARPPRRGTGRAGRSVHQIARAFMAALRWAHPASRPHLRATTRR